jgi:hypothetical protein
MVQAMLKDKLISVREDFQLMLKGYRLKGNKGSIFLLLLNLNLVRITLKNITFI